MVSHPEPDILEREAKWALGSTAIIKANGCNRIPVELFKTLKDDAIKVLHSICQQIWKTQQWPQDWKRSILISIPKKSNSKECASNWTIAFISHASKITLKILHARLQHYANQKVPDVQAGFRKGRGTRYQVANIHWIIEKAREFQKNTYLCFISYAKAFGYVDYNKLWKSLREMEIPDHLICLLRNLYAGQEVTEPCMKQLIVSRLRKEYHRAGCCHSVCLCWEHHEKCRAGWVSSWNQDCQEKYQQP